MARAVFLLIWGVLAAGSSANALTVGQQGTPAAIKTHLIEDQQVEIARAVYVLNHATQDPSKMKTLRVQFMMNSKGTGYVLLSDHRDESKATKTYVYNKIVNGHVYDPRDVEVGIPSEILPKTSEVEALTKCKRLIDTGAIKECRILGDSLRKGLVHGDRVLMHGDLVVRQADGSEKVQGKLTITANLVGPRSDELDHRSILLPSDLDGLTTIDRVFVYTTSSARNGK